MAAPSSAARLSDSSAAWPLSTHVGCMRQSETASSRINRFVALSSTIRTRKSARSVRYRANGGRSASLAQSKQSGEVKGTAFSKLAVHPDMPAHKSH